MVYGETFRAATRHNTSYSYSKEKVKLSSFKNSENIDEIVDGSYFCKSSFTAGIVTGQGGERFGMGLDSCSSNETGWSMLLDTYI